MRAAPRNRFPFRFVPTPVRNVTATLRQPTYPATGDTKSISRNAVCGGKGRNRPRSPKTLLVGALFDLLVEPGAELAPFMFLRRSEHALDLRIEFVASLFSVSQNL